MVSTINQGRIHIREVGLESVVKEAVSSGRLTASSVINVADAHIIAVPTPLVAKEGQCDPQPDLSFIDNVVTHLAPKLRAGDLVILESTAPPGTTEYICQCLRDLRADLLFPGLSIKHPDINIAYCPERVLPGKILEELVSNDRVIGGISPLCASRAKTLYSMLVRGECVLTNARTAEMVKLAENSSRDVQIAFANELSLICDDLNVNPWEVIKLANRHPRVNILNPGPGVGGHCIAVDPWFLVSSSPNHSQLIKTARKVNDSKPDWVVSKVASELSDLRAGGLSGNVTITCYGLAFKADIDDLRESPCIQIVQKIADLEGVNIQVFEPNINELPTNLKYCDLVNLERALGSTGIHLVLVDHSELKNVSVSDFSGDALIDTKGIFS